MAIETSFKTFVLFSLLLMYIGSVLMLFVLIIGFLPLVLSELCIVILFRVVLSLYSSLSYGSKIFGPLVHLDE